MKHQNICSKYKIDRQIADSEGDYTDAFGDTEFDSDGKVYYMEFCGLAIPSNKVFLIRRAVARILYADHSEGGEL